MNSTANGTCSECRMSPKFNSHSNYLNSETNSLGKKTQQTIRKSQTKKNQQLTQQVKLIPFSCHLRVWEEDCEYTGAEHDFWG